MYSIQFSLYSNFNEVGLLDILKRTKKKKNKLTCLEPCNNNIDLSLLLHKKGSPQPPKQLSLQPIRQSFNRRRLALLLLLFTFPFLFLLFLCFLFFLLVYVDVSLTAALLFK